MRIGAFIAVAGLCLSPSFASADAGATRDTVELPQNSVRSEAQASRLKADQSQVVLRPEDWQGRNVSLADLVAEQAGIETRRYGGMGSFQTVTVRGTGGDRLLVYLDDVPLNSAGGGPVDLGKLNLDMLERVEIRKGLAPADEGGNAMGGSLHLYTRGRERNQLHANTAFGSHGLQRDAVSGGFATDTGVHAISVFANVGFSHSDNDFEYLNRNSTPYNPDDDSWATRENSQFRSLDAHIQARFGLVAGQALRLKVARSTNSGGLPGKEGDVTHGSGFSNRLVQYLAAWEYSPHPDGKKLAVEISLDDETPEFHWTKDDPVGWKTGMDTTQLATRSLRSRLQIHGDFPWRSGSAQVWNLSALVSAGNENLKPDGDYAPSSNPSWNNSRRFALTAADLSFQPDIQWTFTLGGHGQWVSDQTEGGLAYYGDTVPPSERTRLYPAGRLGALWRPDTRVSLFANAGWFYNLPSLTDFYGGRWGIVPNPDLRPERGLNLEAGIRRGWRSGFAEACLFRNRVDDAILYQQSANLIKAFNLDATQAQGVELTLDQRLPLGIHESLVATAQETENLSDTYYRGRVLPDQPAWRHVLKTRVPLPVRFSFEYTWDFRSLVYRDPGNLDRVPAQNLHHAMLQWDWKGKVNFSAGVENITDTYYENAYDANPYPGRQFEVALAGNL